MPRTGKRYFHCILCQKRTKPTDRRKITKEQKRILQKHIVSVTDDDVLCSNCRIKCNKNLKKKTERKEVTHAGNDKNFSPPHESISTSKYVRSPPSVTLPLPSTSTSHSSCFICRKPGPKLVVVPASARNSVFLQRKILIPYGTRCCAKHILNDNLTAESLEEISVISQASNVNRSSITDILLYMREVALKNKASRIDFDNEENFSDQQYVRLTGLNRASFLDLLSHIDGRINRTPVRSQKNSLGIFLMKMRSGLSNDVLSSIFNISKASIRRAISAVRSVLMESFVPQNIGFCHVSRQEVINQHTRPLAESLFGGTGNQALLVIDGTYIFIQKSMNFTFQRKSYSLHKGRPLVKPMVIVSTSGYYISVLGPYLARNSDATILNHIMKTNREDVLNWMEEDDIFIVDRGFRDSMEYLEELGIKACMPSFMKKGEKQLSTQDANTSRLVTKIRWVVESSNARIKRWKFLDRILPTSQVPYIGDYIKIVCSISNKYYPPLSTGDATEDLATASKMKYLSAQVNHLKEEVESRKLDSRTAVWRQAGEIENFPRLDEDDIRNITCGTYQLKLCKSYAEEHFHGGADIMVHKDDSHLVRVKIQSRHVSARSYLLWIRYNESNITAWYCKCRSGARVVGVCAHVAAAIWFLALGRYKESLRPVCDWGQFVDDASVIPDTIDESEEEGVEE
ncbi:uncharacterized protein LOC134243712 [Saccostrea cucullata]|uniref:uncharacterized protein LOC134243712 n=1 Tax=Saccostrea cuccullata TaxID=36930 RepID=UPI002ED0D99C